MGRDRQESKTASSAAESSGSRERPRQHLVKSSTEVFIQFVNSMMSGCLA